MTQSNGALVYTAIDFGSNSVKVIVAEKYKSDEINILGTGLVYSKAVKKGVIVDEDGAKNAIEKALKQAQDASNKKINSAFVAISSLQTMFKEVKQTINFANKKEITGLDIEEVCLETRVLPAPREREIIQFIPKSFKVDDIGQIANPKGMTAYKTLEVVGQIVFVPRVQINMIRKVLGQLKIEIEDFIPSSYALSWILLNEDEREIGSLIVELGAHITSVSYYEHDQIVINKAIDTAGASITSVISEVLAVSPKQAEKIKLESGHSYFDNASDELMIDIPNLREDEEPYSQKDLADYIEEQAENILVDAFEALKNQGVKRINGSIILTGGTANMPGIIDLASDILDVPVKLGMPKMIGVREPEYSVAVGTIFAGIYFDNLFDAIEEPSSSTTSASTIELTESLEPMEKKTKNEETVYIEPIGKTNYQPKKVKKVNQVSPQSKNQSTLQRIWENIKNIITNSFN